MLEVGQYIVTNGRLTQITKVGKNHGAPGAWAPVPSGDSGTVGGYPIFMPDWCVKPAVVGETVCRHPRFEHSCGLTHLTSGELAQLL